VTARPRVCLVDDDIFARDAMSLGLTDAGFDVVATPGAAAGLDILARERFDAIVTDLHMPGTDGAALIEEARRRWPALPIVVVTGSTSFGGTTIDDVARELGVDALMVKPFRAQVLVAKLNELLSARR
jgi:DNA-binding response OmpR family regulator